MIVRLLFLVVLLAPLPAYAYIDPGAGSLLLQWLIAVVIGGWVTFRMFSGRILAKLRKKKGDADTDVEVAEDHEDASK